MKTFRGTIVRGESARAGGPVSSDEDASEKLALSETACWRRLKRPEAQESIEGDRADLNRKKPGYGVVAFARVTLGRHAGEAPLLFEKLVAGMPEIISCHNVTGGGDYMMQIVARGGSDSVKPFPEREQVFVLAACLTRHGVRAGKPTCCIPATTSSHPVP